MKNYPNLTSPNQLYHPGSPENIGCLFLPYNTPQQQCVSTIVTIQSPFLYNTLQLHNTSEDISAGMEDLAREDDLEKVRNDEDADCGKLFICCWVGQSIDIIFCYQNADNYRREILNFHKIFDMQQN